MRTWGLRIIVVGILSAVGGSSALAQPRTVEEKKKVARELYDAGSAKYDFGRYQEAIELFTKSYETFPSPVLLFNIAQAHRQLGSCGDAVFFYTRYLEKRPDAANRAEVEGFIRDQKAKCEGGSTGVTGTGATGVTGTTGTGTSGTGTTGTTATATGTTGTGTTATGTGGTTARTGTTGTASSGSGTGATTTGTGGRTAATGTGGTTGGGAVTATGTTGSTASIARVGDDAHGDGATSADLTGSATTAGPSLLAARFGLGPSFPSFGDLDSAPSFGFALGAGYPIALGDLAIDAGALLTYLPVGWEGDSGQTGTVGLTGVMANAGAGMALPAGLRARAELGLGVMVMSGVATPGNPFLATDQMASGALSFFHLRVGVGVEYDLNDRLLLSVQPIVLSWSPTGSLREEVSSITRLEMMAGVGYRL